ncbi:MAG: hypothetical protein JWM57_1970 [Phycisphaerales bacterium]|nr:hypothetical protein [Phycisphaerales bacterium]
MPIDLAIADRNAAGDPTGEAAAMPLLRPGAAVRVNVAWTTDGPAEQIEVRLVYRTAGKGTTDVVRVAAEALAFPKADDRWSATLTLPPDAPPSYDGRLLSISWYAQAEAIGPKKKVMESAELPLIVSPTGRPIIPQQLAK